MATTTMQGGDVAARSAVRSGARCRGSRRATRSPGAPNTPTPCGFPACCTARSSAAPSPTAASSRSTPARPRRCPGVYRVVTSEDVRKVIPEPYYGPAFHDQPILAIDKVHYRRRAGRGRARRRSPRRRGGGAADRRRIRGTAGGLRRGRGRRRTRSWCTRSSSPPAPSPTSSTSRAARAPTSRSISSSGAATSTRPSPRPRTCSSTPSARRRCCTSRSSRSRRSPTGTRRASRSTPPRRVRRSCAPKSRACSAGRRTACASRCPISAAASARKLYIKLEALVTALSMIVRRPVKVALTMEEQFYTITKHPSTFRIKTGVDKNGRITARKCEVYWNGGAYADVGPRVTQKSGFTASGPYDIDNVWIDSYALYTNVPPAGALRGFGIPQLVWAYESHTDMIARALKLDPLEFRRKNILREGRPHATGQILEDAKLERVLERVAERLSWTKPFDRGTGTLRRGRGLAIAIKAVISPTTSVAIVNIAGDGSATLVLRHRRHGPGLRHRDGADGRRSAQHPGREREGRAARHRRHALRHGHARLALAVPHGPRGAAARPRKRATRSRRSRAMSASPKAATFRSPSCSRRNTACRPATSSAPASTSRTTCRRDPAPGSRPMSTPFWMCAAAGAEVEVDTETGQVKIARAHQRGRLRHGRSIRRSSRRRFPARADAARLHHVREDAPRRRPGDQRLARRLQDSGNARRAAR